ncbi:Uncharacterized protein OBRU01_25958, partial [Operophtera brumata]
IQRDRVQADEVPFQEAVETGGFYNRPPGSGRYPVRVENAPYRVDQQSIYAVQQHQFAKNSNSDGTLDSLQYCKCVSTPDCNPHQDSDRACGSGQFLCCYKRANKGNQQNSEFFNEIDDERPMLLPGRESGGRPFPSPADTQLNGFFGPGHSHEAALVGEANRGVLVGPQGPTGHIGYGNPGVLVGPDGPSGHIGPVNQNPGIFVGPNSSGKKNPGVLVGPGGPTGIIGPANNNANKGHLIDGPIDPIHPDESAQRGVLVGPGGPTGLIGPQGGYGRRPVLVGPGGPTGIIGPRRPGGFRGYFNNGYGRPMGRGVLVGPGGPTGTIGPGRGLLVGPSGPTGMIGPQEYFGK